MVIIELEVKCAFVLLKLKRRVFCKFIYTLIIDARSGYRKILPSDEEASCNILPSDEEASSI